MRKRCDVGVGAANGIVNDIKNPSERATVAADGWARWVPLSAAAIGAHLVGGLGLILAYRYWVKNQSGVTANTAMKTGLTGLALATTAYSGVLGAKLAKDGDTPVDGGAIPAAQTNDTYERDHQY